MVSTSLAAANTDPAAAAINALALDLHRQLPKDGNACLSPYSIQSALAMTYLGASGVTQKEMARVLHLPEDKQTAGESFAALRLALQQAQKDSAAAVARAKDYGGPSEPLALNVANRLFGQKGYEFRKPFLEATQQHFEAPVEELGFREDADGARLFINQWVEEQTQKRIRDLLPMGALDASTRLVLVNALYFKAAWADEFSASATKPAPFHVQGGKSTELVPTMRCKEHLRYHQGKGFQAVALPYAGGALHFLVVVPDKINGLAEVEAELTPETLQACGKAETQEIILYLPKFKLAPPSLPLKATLQKLGMKTAFDIPAGSADFDAMAPRSPGDYLCLSEVFHKTFIEIDEKGTEAAAATAVVMMARSAAPAREEPLELKADRPFLYAIQHTASGACLFLGRVADPR